MKKAENTTRPFKYDLNQIPYDYTVEVVNRFNRLIWKTECLKNYGQRLGNTVQEVVTKCIPKKKKCKKAKWLNEERNFSAESRLGPQFPGVLGSATSLAWGFPGDSDGKESACQNRIQVQSLDQEDSPGVGNGNPLQSSCLGNPMDRGA